MQFSLIRMSGPLVRQRPSSAPDTEFRLQFHQNLTNY